MQKIKIQLKTIYKVLDLLQVKLVKIESKKSLSRVSIFGTEYCIVKHFAKKLRHSFWSLTAFTEEAKLRISQTFDIVISFAKCSSRLS